MEQSALRTHRSIPNLKGNSLLKALARLIQIGRLYDDNNKLALGAVEAFKQSVTHACSGNDQVTLQIYYGRFYMDEERLPLIRKEAKIFNQMLQFFEQRAISGFHFCAQLDKVTTKNIFAFIRFFNNAAQHDNPYQWLVRELDKWDLHWLAVINVPTISRRTTALETQMEKAGDMVRKAEAAKKTYHYALNSVKEVAEKLLSDQEAGIRKTVRMVQRMVDIITDDDRTFLALSTIRMYDDYTFAHSLNVALLAMSLGKRIGMDSKTLENLGLCGLFHDLGKIEIPKEILNKRGKLNASEFEEIKKHSVYSAMLILKLKTDKCRKVHLFVSPFEHHIRYDHSGYPSLDKKRPISLFGRILTIVDVYDAITSPRIYRQTSMSPDRALGIMLADSGKHFDPILLKAFVNMLGVYPVGTLLVLDSGEIGLAMHNSTKTDRERPLVQLLVKDGKHQFKKGKIIDLSDKIPGEDRYKRNIMDTRHPATLGIQPATFMV